MGKEETRRERVLRAQKKNKLSAVLVVTILFVAVGGWIALFLK